LRQCGLNAYIAKPTRAGSAKKLPDKAVAIIHTPKILA
jgi:hypothetical protein